MMRRSLFFGLTLILVLAFTFISLRGCKQEEAALEQPTETTEESAASATRALKPLDLEITRSKTVLERSSGSDTKKSLRARHEVDVFNRGSVPYKELMLHFAYLSSNGKSLEERDHSIAKTILPGAVLKLSDIRMDGISESAADARVSIIYADIGK